jgi:hypothetical protein
MKLSQKLVLTGEGKLLMLAVSVVEAPSAAREKEK